MIHSSGNTPENRGKVLKYLLFGNRVELPEKDGTFVRRKKKCFCYNSPRFFSSPIYLIVLVN